jgi:hypothetical protein
MRKVTRPFFSSLVAMPCRILDVVKVCSNPIGRFFLMSVGFLQHLSNFSEVGNCDVGFSHGYRIIGLIFASYVRWLECDNAPPVLHFSSPLVTNALGFSLNPCCVQCITGLRKSGSVVLEAQSFKRMGKDLQALAGDAIGRGELGVQLRRV